MLCQNTLMSKLFIMFLLSFCYLISFAGDCDDCRWTAIGRRIQPELKMVIEDFIANNDTTKFFDIATAIDKDGTYCFYEAEYFMYCLMIALDKGNSSAFFEADRLLSKFYDDNNLEKGGFAITLSIFFQSKGKVFFSDEEVIDSYSSIKAQSLISYSKRFNRVFAKDSFLINIIHDSDSFAYLSLLEMLQKECYKEEKSISEDKLMFRLIFYSVYHIDKNNSHQGYFMIYNLIVNYLYNLNGISLTENSSRLALYFLKKAAKLGNVSAKNELLRLEQDLHQ